MIEQQKGFIGTEQGALHELPGGWVWTKLGEIIAFEYGKGLKADKRENKGNIPVYGSNGIVGYHTIPLIEKPCLIIGRKGAAGYVHISNVPCWAIDTTYYMIPPDELNLVFLYFILSTLNLNSLDKSTAIPGLNRNDAYALYIPLPPLLEQRAIVAKIEQLFSDLDNGIANLKKAQEQLKIYRQAVLKKAFEGELTRKWRAEQTDLPSAEELLQQIKEERERHYQKQLDEWKEAVKEWEDNGKEGKKPSRPKKPKDLPPLSEGELKELPKLPDGRCWKKIGNICECIVPNRDKPKSFTGNVKWITTPDLQIDSIRLNYSNVENGLSEMEIKKYNAKVIPLGSVIMTCVGKFGISAIVEKRIVVNQQLHAFLPVNFCYNKYLAYGIQYNKVYFEKRATSTTIQYLNKNNCNSMPFSFCSLQEQHQIVKEIETRLSVCDKLEATIAEALQKSEALRQSILKKAFEGKLLSEKELEEARNAPDWEPADKLLERIKTEKEKPGNKKSFSGTYSK